MLYTPMLPEAASGTLEPRHVVVPLRMMCPHAELLLGRATTLDEAERRVHVVTDTGEEDVEYDQLVVALGAVPRALPIPGLSEHALGFKSLADAIHLRNHVLRRLEAAAAATDPREAERQLTFVFIGAGYAGVEALAELSDLVRDAMRYYPTLRTTPQRWVLVDAAPKILPEIPTRLGEYAADRLVKRGVDIRVSTTLTSAEGGAATLSDGTRIETHTLVWTAGVKAHPLLSRFGLPLDDRGRIVVGPTLRVEGRDNVWALGDCARVPNEATPDHPDPPTCQHALRQARRLARNLRGRPAAVPLPHARPGGDPRALQGDRRRPRPPPARLPRLVRHPHVPPATSCRSSRARRASRSTGRSPSSSAATSPSSPCSAGRGPSRARSRATTSRKHRRSSSRYLQACPRPCGRELPPRRRSAPSV